MADNGFKVKNKLNISPSTTAGTAVGDIRVDSSDSNKLKFHDGSSEDSLVVQADLDATASDLSNHISDTSTHGISSDIVGRTESQTLTNKTIDADSNTISNIDNADIKSGAAIARNKLANGTASHVIINDGSGVMSSEASLAITRGGTGQTVANDGFNALAPSQTSNSGKYLQTDGSNTSWQTVTSGANTALSNLTTTAINQNLTHGTANTAWTVSTADNGSGSTGTMSIRAGQNTGGTRGNVQLKADTVVLGDAGTVSVVPANGGILGSSSAPFSANFTTLNGIASAAIRFVLAGGSTATPSSGSVFGTIQSNDSTGFTVFSVSQAGNTGPVSVETGNSSSFASGTAKIQTGTANTTSGAITVTTGNATGNSGNITITTGTSSATRGAISLVNGSEGTAGHVWTSTNTTGAGAWAPASGGGATIELDNLGTTNINASLLFDTGSTYNIASEANILNAVYSTYIYSQEITSPTGSALVLRAIAGPLDLYSDNEVIRLLSTNAVVAPQLEFWDSGGSNSANIKSPDSLASTYTLTLPVDAGASGEVLSTDGTGVLSWVSPGGGATIELDNLGTTNINANLLFDTDGTYYIGGDGIGGDGNALAGIRTASLSCNSGTQLTVGSVDDGKLFYFDNTGIYSQARLSIDGSSGGRFQNQISSGNPASPLQGDMYYDSDDDTIKYYTGAVWKTVVAT